MTETNTRLPRRDWRDDMIADQAAEIASLQGDVVTYRDLLIRLMAHAYHLNGQIRVQRRQIERLRHLVTTSLPQRAA